MGAIMSFPPTWAPPRFGPVAPAESTHDRLVGTRATIIFDMGASWGSIPMGVTESSPLANVGTPWVFTFGWDRPATVAETSNGGQFDARVCATFTEKKLVTTLGEIVSSTS